MKKLLIFLAGFATATILRHIGQWAVNMMTKRIENFNAEAREFLDDWHEWTEEELAEWMKGEAQVDEYIRKGEVEKFNTMEEFISSLTESEE